MIYGTEETSLVGRIHAVLSHLQKQGRISCADASVVHALTLHPELPDFYRSKESSPVYPPIGENRAICFVPSMMPK
jgi:hypothetical protein